MYARKDAREPPAGPDPIITQSVVKSGGLESLTSVWPAPATTSRAWETMMKSGLIDGKSDLCNYYSFLQVDVRPHRLCLPHIRPMRYWNADRQILHGRLHLEALGHIQVVPSQIRLALSTQSPASRDLQGVRREQSRNKESEIIEAEWTASRDAGLRMPIPFSKTTHQIRRARPLLPVFPLRQRPHSCSHSDDAFVTGSMSRPWWPSASYYIRRVGS